MALKFACEANAYESCVELIDELMVVRFSGKHPRRNAYGLSSFRFEDVLNWRLSLPRQTKDNSFIRRLPRRVLLRDA
jgi:hypothetical protein